MVLEWSLQSQSAWLVEEARCLRCLTLAPAPFSALFFTLRGKHFILHHPSSLAFWLIARFDPGNINGRSDGRGEQGLGDYSPSLAPALLGSQQRPCSPRRVATVGRPPALPASSSSGRATVSSSHGWRWPSAVPVS